MSIEAMKMALEALENASPSAWASRVDSDTMKSIWRKHAEVLEGLQVLIAELDNASCKSVQKRLEAKQPATGEPVLFIHPDTFAMNNAHVGAWKPGHELTSYIPLYTHPAPSVPDDVVRDAERYRWLRDHDHWPAPFSSSQEPEPVRGRDLDAAIDAAMLAAKEGGA